MQKITATYKQQIQTIHPDTLIEVPFRYAATVDKDEEVNVEWVQLLDGQNSTHVRIAGNSEDMRRFLATIREHARETAYKIRKANGNV
jgi:hypothetical protein